MRWFVPSAGCSPVQVLQLLRQSVGTTLRIGAKMFCRTFTRSSLILRASRDFFAASLFRFLLSKYFSSFCSSGIGRFSPLGLLKNEPQKTDCDAPFMLSGDFIEFGLVVGDLTKIVGEFENSDPEDIFDCIESFASGRIDSSGGKVWFANPLILLGKP